jgi:hypothetical protein
MPGKLALLFIVLLSLTGCSMKKYCAERFPPSQIIRDSISYVETIAFRDTTIYIRIPFEQAKDSVNVDTLTGTAYSTLTTSFAWSYASLVNGKLHHYLQQKDSLVEARIKDAIKQHSRIEYKEKIVEKHIEVNKLSKFQGFQIYAAWVLAIFIIISSIIRKIPTAILKKALKFITPKKPQ